MRYRFGITALTFALMLCSSLQAEIVRFRLTGKVAITDWANILPADLVAGADTDIFNPPDPEAPGGKRFVAFWSYDTSIPDASPELPYSGVYPHPLADPLVAEFGLAVHIDNYVFRLDTLAEPYTVGVGVGRLSSDCSFGCGDGIGTNQTNVLVPFEYDSPTIIHDRITLHIGDSFFSTANDSSLPSDALPTSLDLSEFDYARIQIDGAGEVWVGSSSPPHYFIQAFIEDITVVPEPTASRMLLLYASCLLSRFRPERCHQFRDKTVLIGYTGEVFLHRLGVTYVCHSGREDLATRR